MEQQWHDCEGADNSPYVDAYEEVDHEEAAARVRELKLKGGRPDDADLAG